MHRSLFIFAASASLAFTQDASSVRLIAVKNAPFSAQAQTQSIQTLPDGNQVTRKSSAIIARDSEGRTRREKTGTGVVFIYDPIQGLASVLDAKAKTARQYAIPLGEVNSESPTGAPLGADMIEGLPVEGTRLTRQIAAGEAGNEGSIEVTSDAWYSDDLRIVLSSRTVDPRTGETTYKVTGIKRAEPDAALFQIPADFKTNGPQTR